MHNQITPVYSYTPKDFNVVNLQNKILINDAENKNEFIEPMSMINIASREENKPIPADSGITGTTAVNILSLLSDKIVDTNKQKEEDKENNKNDINIPTNNTRKSKPSIDLCVVNESETNRIFAQSVANSCRIIKKTDTGDNKTPINECIASSDNFKSEEQNLTTSNISNDDHSIKSASSQIKQEIYNKLPVLAMNTTPKASLNISPKSAFVQMKR